MPFSLSSFSFLPFLISIAAECTDVVVAHPEALELLLKNLFSSHTDLRQSAASSLGYLCRVGTICPLPEAARSFAFIIAEKHRSVLREKALAGLSLVSTDDDFEVRFFSTLGIAYLCSTISSSGPLSLSS